MAVFLGLIFGFLFSSLQGALIASFSIIFSLWLVSVIIIDLAYGYSVGPVLADMLGLKSLLFLYLLSSLLPAFIGALGAWVGFNLKKLF